MDAQVSHSATGDGSRSSQGIDSAVAAPEVDIPSQYNAGIRQRKVNSTDIQDDFNSTENQVDDISCDDVEDFWINKKAFVINRKINKFLAKYSKTLKYIGATTAVLLYFCYLGAAIYFSPKGAIPLILGTIFVIFVVVFNTVSRKTVTHREKLKERWRNWKGQKYLHYVGIIFMVILVLGVLIFVCYDSREKPSNLISLAGMVIFILLGFLLSRSRTTVRWRIGVASLLVQFLFGFLIVRWDKGLATFEWMATQVTTFLYYTDYGTKFVFGEMYTRHGFIMQAVPVLIYFGAWIGVLSHLGILQKIIMTIGYVIQTLIGVGPIEAFVAAASIFFDANLSVLAVSSFLKQMTISELHSVMTYGFSTVAVGLYGIYLSAGISPSSLMAASVMSAPAALGMSKIMCPETEESKIADVEKIKFSKLENKSLLEAYSQGAKEGFMILVQVSVALVAGVALLSLIDGTMIWFGARVGILGFSFAKLTSYLFYPVAFVMGVDTADCFEVARLLGMKLFLTEIVGYQELGILIKNREMGLTPSVSPRSEAIATFGLCGFSSFPDIAILLSALSILAPTRKSDIAGIALRAMVTANISCYLSACVAGTILYFSFSKLFKTSGN